MTAAVRKKKRPSLTVVGPNGLTEFEARFCDEFVRTRDAELALSRANSKAPKGGPSSVRATLYRLFQRKRVVEYIAQVQAQARQTAGIDVGQLALQALEWASVSAGDVVDVKTGRVRDDASPMALRAVQQIKIDKDGNVNVTMPDRVRALNLASELLGFKKAEGGDVPAAIKEIFELFNRAQRIEQAKPLLPSLRGELYEG